VAVGSNATFTVVATGTAPLAFQWRFNGAAIFGATNSAYVLNGAKIGDAGSYSVQVTNAAGSVLSVPAALTVLQPPLITTQPIPQSVAIGSNATFSVVATGTAPLAFQWRFNGAMILGATSSAYVLNSAQATNAGNYSVQVTNTAGSVLSAQAALSVLQPPSITTQPTLQSVAVGSNATFSVVATGTAPLAYQWCLNGATILGATNSVYVLNGAQVTNAGNYSVQVTNAAGSVLSAQAALTVLQPPVITSQPVDQYLTLGSTATFSVVAAGSAPLSYQWFLNGSRIAGATSGTYTKSNVKTQNLGNYSVQVSDAVGSVLSATAVLAVIQAPTITSQPSSQSTALGSNATFTVVAAGGALNYQWLLNGGSIPGATSSSLTRLSVQLLDAGNYSVRVTNTAGSVLSASAALSVFQPTNVVAAPTQFQVLSSSLKAGVFQLAVPTESGRSYSLEYSDTLPGSNWIPLSPVIGDGTVKTLQDSNATNQFRYYRVRSQPL
jgi:hypothetical protein